MWNNKIPYFILACTASLAVYAQPAICQVYSCQFPATYDKWQEALLAGDGKMGIMHVYSILRILPFIFSGAMDFINIVMIYFS